MDLETVKKYLEKGVGGGEDKNASTIDGMPSRFFENFIMQGLHVDHIEKGRLLCSMKVPPRLLNAGNFLHGGATASLVDLVGSAVVYTYGVSSSGVSVEISITYLDAAYVGEEIEIEAKALRVGKTVAVITVEFRKKKTGKIIAQGRHTKYLAVQNGNLEVIQSLKVGELQGLKRVMNEVKVEISLSTDSKITRTMLKL
ncbi:hypothetical protein V6N11_015473 [Hibiscus sabdariffa]|uniref:Thioesterase domain-containing protein n=1 Tax=Hibiscus sabdariffa TaxID=183260 RepID=A0ABR2TS63_9ROSI